MRLARSMLSLRLFFAVAVFLGASQYGIQRAIDSDLTEVSHSSGMEWAYHIERQIIHEEGAADATANGEPASLLDRETLDPLMRDIIAVGNMAEGVEGVEQHDLLREMGVNMAQGYLYAHPMPEAEVPDCLIRLFGQKTTPSDVRKTG